MEQLYYELTQETDKTQVAEYIQEQSNTIEFGSILIQILQNDQSLPIPHDDSKFLFNCSVLLKNWAKINLENMTIDQKIQFFDDLKMLILNIQEQYVLTLSDGFIDIAIRVNESDDPQIFEKHYDDFFNSLSTQQNCSIPQIMALLNIINLASRKYKWRSKFQDLDEPSTFLKNVIESIIPYLENEDLMQSQEGCYILGLVLKIFRRPFLIVEPPIEEASLVLDFSKNIEIEFIKQEFLNTQLVCAAVSLLKHFYKSSYKKPHFTDDAPQILQTHFDLLSSALEFKLEDSEPNYNLISKTLEVIEQFQKYITPEQNIIDILLESSILTPIDKVNFNANPFMFYDDVYKKKYDVNKNNSARLARSIIANFCHDSEVSATLISYMISLPPSENIIRCLGICIHVSEDVILPESIIPYYQDLIENESYYDDQLLITSILDFLHYLVPHLPIEQNMKIMDILPTYFKEYQENIIITLMLTRLLKSLIKADIFPFDNAIDFIINYLGNSITSHPIKCIKEMCKISPELVTPYADFIIDGIFENFTHSLHFSLGFEGEEEEEECDKVIENQENETSNIESNLDFCAKLISSTGPYLVKPLFIDVVKQIIESEACDLVDPLVDLLVSIFGSNSPLIPEFIEIIIDACRDETWEGFSDILIYPFFKLISSHPSEFIQLNICNDLSEFCMEMLRNTELKEKGSYFNFATLLSWILIIDSQNNNEIGEDEVQSIYQYAESVCTSEEPEIVFLSSFLEILASISISYQILPTEEIIHLMVKANEYNWTLRLCQKQLYIIFFLRFAVAQNEAADSVVPIAFDLMSRMEEQNSVKKDDEDQYFQDQSFPPDLSSLIISFPFKSPVEGFSLVADALAALDVCQRETVELVQNKFPSIFNQLVVDQQNPPA